MIIISTLTQVAERIAVLKQKIEKTSDYFLIYGYVRALEELEEYQNHLKKENMLSELKKINFDETDFRVILEALTVLQRHKVPSKSALAGMLNELINSIGDENTKKEITKEWNDHVTKREEAARLERDEIIFVMGKVVQFQRLLQSEAGEKPPIKPILG